MILAKIHNYLIENGHKVLLNEDDEYILYDLEKYFDEVFMNNDEFLFDSEEDIAELVTLIDDEFENKIDSLRKLTLYVANTQPYYLKETIKSIMDTLYSRNARYDKRAEYMDAFFGWYCENLQHEIENDEIMNKIGKYIWNEIEDENADDIEDKIGEERFNRFATIYDSEYWVRKLENDEYINISEVYEELFSTPEEKLLPYVDKIASAIDSAGNMNYDQKRIQRKILEYIENRGYKTLLQRVLESSNLWKWSPVDFGLAKISEQAKKEDRRNNRISVEEANKIIEQCRLSDILEAREGYVGLEDMVFDYLYDKQTGKQLAESEFDGKPWFHGRSFGDKQMSRDWFCEMIEKYLKN